eukprot:jgi/Hompol1/2448/HPOL_001524-RA
MKRQHDEQLATRLQQEAEKWDARLKAEQKIRLQQHERASSTRSEARARTSVTSADSGETSPIEAPSTSTSSSVRFPPGTPSIVAIERLQATIKQNETLIASLQMQLRLATQTRDEMADELVKVTNECEELRAKSVAAAETELRLSDLTKRYNTALEILGEKTERVDELQADIDDMKIVFKKQVEELVRQLGATASLK